MRTVLDDYFELSLEKVVDEDIFLTCQLIPMMRAPHHKIIPNHSHKGFEVKFQDVAGYFVLPEAVQVGMDFRYIDSFHLTQVESSSAISFFGIDQVYPSTEYRHWVIRTAHYFVNIFTDTEPVLVVAEDSGRNIHISN